MVNYTAPTATDNCGAKLKRTGLASGSQFPIGTSTIEFTATDVYGNTDVCSFTITVKAGDQPPVFANCPSAINVDTDPGICGANVTFATPTASDENGNLEVNQTEGPKSGEIFPVGATKVTFLATDSSNNTATCSFNVTVTDNEDPVITCPADITVTADFGANGKVVTYDPPVFTDNCSATMKRTAGLASGSEFPIGDTVNTFLVTDASGNTHTCSFTITVNEKKDTVKPEITCPEAISVNNDKGICGAVVNYPLPTATDNSGNPTVSLKDGPAPGDTFPVGTTKVTYTATDDAGNTSECSFQVMVIDAENPLITCSNNITATVPVGQNSKVITYETPTFTDNCPGGTIERTEGLASGSEFPVGTTNIIFVATDAAGNQAICKFKVTVNTEKDTQPPVFENCPSDISQDNDAGQCGAISKLYSSHCDR